MGAQSLCRPFWHAEASRWFVLIQLSTLKTHYKGIRKEGGCHEPIKVVQPLSSLFGSAETPWTTLRPAAVPDGLPVLRISIDHSRDMLNRLKGREVELELLDA